ncbi:unnamed protein product, partial [Prorocentrum cordatum]
PLPKRNWRRAQSRALLDGEPEGKVRREGSRGRSLDGSPLPSWHRAAREERGLCSARPAQRRAPESVQERAASRGGEALLPEAGKKEPLRRPTGQVRWPFAVRRSVQESAPRQGKHRDPEHTHTTQAARTARKPSRAKMSQNHRLCKKQSAHVALIAWCTLLESLQQASSRPFPLRLEGHIYERWRSLSHTA